MFIIQFVSLISPHALQSAPTSLPHTQRPRRPDETQGSSPGAGAGPVARSLAATSSCRASPRNGRCCTQCQPARLASARSSHPAAPSAGRGGTTPGTRPTRTGPTAMPFLRGSTRSTPTGLRSISRLSRGHPTGRTEPATGGRLRERPAPQPPFPFAPQQTRCKQSKANDLPAASASQRRDRSGANSRAPRQGGAPCRFFPAPGARCGSVDAGGCERPRHMCLEHGAPLSRCWSRVPWNELLAGSGPFSFKGEALAQSKQRPSPEQPPARGVAWRAGGRPGGPLTPC